MLKFGGAVSIKTAVINSYYSNRTRSLRSHLSVPKTMFAEIVKKNVSYHLCRHSHYILLGEMGSYIFPLFFLTVGWQRA